MAYIGRGIENFSQIEVLDLITFTDSVGPYNILKDAVAFVPSTVNSLLIEVDGIIQAPASYTISGSTITFGVSMSSSSTMNSMIHFGTGLITTPVDGSVTAAKIASDAVTTAKILDNNVTVAKLPTTLNISGNTVTLPASVSGLGTGITNAQLAGSIDVTSKITGVVPTANLGSGTASASTYLAGDQTYKALSEYDDNQVQSNIAMLGFKVATNGSLVKYSLVDQTIDEFNDTSGVDASASTNELRNDSAPYYYYGGTTITPSVTEDADSVATDGDYTVYKWTGTGAGSYNTDTTQDHEYLIVAGGGSGGYGNAGGAGAGGYLAATGLSLTGGNTYVPVVGAGGTAITSGDTQGIDGTDSTLTGTGITTLTAVGGGGGGATVSGVDGRAGGSGGGSSYINGDGGAGTSGQGNTGGGGNMSAAPCYGGSGGGGAGQIGQPGTSTNGGDGGIGISNDITGSAVWYAGGGGGSMAGGCADSTAGNYSSGANGRTQGGGGNGTNASGTLKDATANTGGGGGGTSTISSGVGGSGIIILRRLTSTTSSGGNLTLQSTDSTAGTAPNYGEFVTLIENAYGTATLNTDIKGYISRDSGTTFTQGTLVDEGTWGTNKKILGFHDLDISAQPSGTSMCYKIETLNQSVSSKETRIYASSIGWR